MLFVKNRKHCTLKNKHHKFYNSTLGQEEGSRKRLKQRGGIRTEEGGENQRGRIARGQRPLSQAKIHTVQERWGRRTEEGGNRNMEWELAGGEVREPLGQLLDSWGMES